MTNTAMCRCGTRWHQSGNRTGHCAQCHRTFSGVSTFDAHQRMEGGKCICLDPAALLTKAGEAKFKTFADRLGTTVWRSAADQPEDMWEVKTA